MCKSDDNMDTLNWIKIIQDRYNGGLILTGLAALEYPLVQTKQFTFYNPKGGKQDYYAGSCHVFIRRASKANLSLKDHLIFIARHIEFYAGELELLTPILADIHLNDFESNDSAWRVFAYLKEHCLGEKVRLKKIIGRRYIDFGDIKSPKAINDKSLHIRDALFVPSLRREIWVPKITSYPDSKSVDEILIESHDNFQSKELKPLFNQFKRYASRLESAASAKIEGYDAQIGPGALSQRTQVKLKQDVSLQAGLNMDNLYRDLTNLAKEPFSMDLLLAVQEAIVSKTWRDEEEKKDKTPGRLREFDEVIVDRGKMGRDNVVYVAPKSADVPVLLRELIDFFHSSQYSLHPLILAAFFHCQLVIIHPFGDGNGRLARWCFLYTLIQKGFIKNVHQAPISHIFLQEKNRYYKELSNVDKGVMKYVSYKIDKATRRFEANYDDVNIYRNLDYSSWLSYVYDAFQRAVKFSMDEHVVFENAQRIYGIFEKKYPNISASLQHEIFRAIDIGIRREWGKKTERRLLNNGLHQGAIDELKVLCAGYN